MYDAQSTGDAFMQGYIWRDKNRIVFISKVTESW